MEPKPVVLIVEDEFLVRVFAVDIAEEAGFSAVEAADADEAIRVLQNRPDIRVVLADIDLPGHLDGLELAQAIRHRWPPIQVVVTSGMMRPEPPRVFRRLFGLSHAAIAGWSSVA